MHSFCHWGLVKLRMVVLYVHLLVNCILRYAGGWALRGSTIVGVVCSTECFVVTLHWHVSAHACTVTAKMRLFGV